MRKIKEITGDSLVILTGDFNITPDFETYKILTGKNEDNTLQDLNLTDTCIDENGNPITKGTFTAFGSIEEYWKIDYIFIKNNIEVQLYKFVDDNNDVITSDRYPVTAKYIIKYKHSKIFFLNTKAKCFSHKL